MSTITCYGGTLNVTTGVLTCTYAYVDLGDLNYTKTTTPSPYNVVRFDTTLSDALPPPSNNDVADLLCSHYGKDTVNRGYTGDADNIVSMSTGKTLQCYISNLASDTVEQFKSDMTGVQLVYALATPVQYQLTPEQIAALVGDNNVFHNANGTVEVEFKESVEKYVNDHGGGASWTDVVGTLTAGQTSITLNSAAITTTSTIQVFSDPDIPYNSITVSNGQAVLTFDAQPNNVLVKVRVT